MLSILYEWFLWFLLIFLSLIYPVFRSLRIIRGKESPSHLQPVLKYWVIYSIIYFADTYLEALIAQMFDFYEYLRLFLYLGLVINFHLSTIIYDNVVGNILAQNEDRIDGFVASVQYWVSKCGELFVSYGKIFVHLQITKLFGWMAKVLFYKPKSVPENKKP